MRFIQFRSAPAQNALPAPASTMTRTVSSLSTSWKTLVKSAIRTSSNALRTSGRLRVTMATVLRFSTIRFSDIFLSGDAGFDDHFGFHGIGDEAALVRFVVQLRELLGRRPGAGESDDRPERHLRHCEPPLRIFREHAGGFVAIARNDELRVVRKMQEPEHVAGRERGHELLLGVDAGGPLHGLGDVSLPRVAGQPDAMAEVDRMGARIGGVLEFALQLPLDGCAIFGHELHASGHILKTPNFVSSIGALSDAEIASPSSRRMSAGSTTPSSQSRALA